MYWIDIQGLDSKSYKCGYCGNSVASDKGYYSKESSNVNSNNVAGIYICHHCTKPTFIEKGGNQTPGILIGNEVNHIPDSNVKNLFNESRLCYSVGAFTSSVMCCRKLLMNVSVSEGAEEGLGFVDYINYLNVKNYIPPNGKQWVDSIRKLGNEANHKIEFKNKSDATRIINFTEMLLRFIYELPGIMKET